MEIEKSKMPFNSVSDALDRVCKRQKLSVSASHEVIDQVGREIEQTLADIESGHVASWALVHPGGVSTSPIDQRLILAELKSKLNTIAPLSKLEESQKELNISLSKYPKVLEKTLNPDVSKAYRNVEFDKHTVNQIILDHLYRNGLFDVGDSMVNEAAGPEVISLRLKYLEMHQILEAVRFKNLEPALRWVTENQDQLNIQGSALKLKLLRLQFVGILQNGTQADALTYARANLAPLANLYIDEIQKLMGCLLWAGKLEKSPYFELASPCQWERLSEDLTQQFCSLMGQPSQSPLGVALAAGIHGLPTLLKLANVMAGKRQDWETMKQLPVPVELDQEFQFHSIFVCPVSREQSSEENPPMLLPCGHVLCKHSIHKLSKSSTRNFKCPYCPHDTTAPECRRLYF